MKKLLFICVASILTFIQFGFNQPVENNVDITQQVATAIRTGNASELAKYFNSTIDITLPSNEGSYSQAQAEMIVKGFFQKYPPQSFTINNQGTSKGGMRFAIGTLTTKSGNFRTYFMMKDVAGKTVLQQLQFENQ